MTVSAHAVKITYDLNSGQLPNGDTGSSIETNGNEVVLINPTKTTNEKNYIFAGWISCPNPEPGTNYDSNQHKCNSNGTRIITDGNSSYVRWTVPATLNTDTVFIAQWEEDKFQITTTNLSANSVFSFNIKSLGEYYIDWGDGNIEYKKLEVKNSFWPDENFSHTYANSGKYTIRFGGAATEYGGYEAENSVMVAMEIANSSRAYINAISGSLGRVFPTLSNPANATDVESMASVQPSFANLFANCTNLTSSLPANLFDGIYGIPVLNMFKGMFKNSGITGVVPSGLFANIYGDISQLSNAYDAVAGEAVFAETFSNCTGLTTIQRNLFSVTDELTITAGMFDNMFSGCSGLTEIEDYAFSFVVGTAPEAFFETFANCTSLKELPTILFPRITGKPSVSMFYGMFSGCTNLGVSKETNTPYTYYVPSALFGRLDSNDDNYGAMLDIFVGTKLATKCPNGTEEFKTPFRRNWCESFSCSEYTSDIETEYAVSCNTPNEVCPSVQINSDRWVLVSNNNKAMSADFNDNNSKCFTVVLSAENPTALANYDYVGAGINAMALCRYNSQTETYADNCTIAMPFCDQQDFQNALQRLYGGSDEGVADWYATVIKNDENATREDIKNDFTYSLNNIPALNRCSLSDVTCPERTLTLGSGWYDLSDSTLGQYHHNVYQFKYNFGENIMPTENCVRQLAYTDNENQEAVRTALGQFDFATAGVSDTAFCRYNIDADTYLCSPAAKLCNAEDEANYAQAIAGATSVAPVLEFFTKLILNNENAVPKDMTYDTPANSIMASTNCTTCPAELYVLDTPMCLLEEQPNGNSLVARRNNQIFYAKLSTTDSVVTSGSSHKLVIKINGVPYYAHDESVSE